MLHTIRLSLAGLAVAALSACVGNSITQPAFIGTFDPKTLGYIASKGPLYTQIVGNPFLVSDEEVGRIITRTMVGAHFGPEIQFTTERDPANTSPYRVVMVLNPGPGVSARNLCHDTPLPTAGRATGSVHVAAALCASKDRETSLTGSIAAVTSPDDTAFRALIRQMTAELFPPRNPNLISPNNFEI